MTDMEVLEGYRAASSETRALEEYIESLCSLSGTLRDSRADCLAEAERCRRELESRRLFLTRLRRRLEAILAKIPDLTARVVMRSYYALGLSDEKTGEAMNLSRTAVNKRRRLWIEKLNEAERVRKEGLEIA